MKVKELCAKLREFDQDLAVVARFNILEEQEIYDAVNSFIADVYLDDEWNIQFDDKEKGRDYKSVIVIA